MGIKESDICGLCIYEVDSVERILLSCEVSKEILSDINDWIIDLGNGKLQLIIENALSIDSIILLAKKTIYISIMNKQRT